MYVTKEVRDRIKQMLRARVGTKSVGINFDLLTDAAIGVFTDLDLLKTKLQDTIIRK